MRKQHRHKPIPTPKPSRMSFCAALLHYLFKFGPRKHLEQLIQDAAKSFHGADSSSLITKLGRFVDPIQRISPFSVPLPKPNLDSSAYIRRGVRSRKDASSILNLISVIANVLGGLVVYMLRK